MSKRKISAEDKLSAVRQYMDGKWSQRHIASLYGVSQASFQQWPRNYNSFGEEAFAMKGNKKYPKELKEQAVQDYLCGNSSLNEIGNLNNNALVFETFDADVAANPDAHPLFHSDLGFQYTCRAFHSKLEAAGMKQSMSRVAKRIDNGPMEGFWGILKRERYYGRRFKKS